jgi:hypothetical protein
VLASRAARTPGLPDRSDHIPPAGGGTLGAFTQVAGPVAGPLEMLAEG